MKEGRNTFGNAALQSHHPGVSGEEGEVRWLVIIMGNTNQVSCKLLNMSNTRERVR